MSKYVANYTMDVLEMQNERLLQQSRNKQQATSGSRSIKHMHAKLLKRRVNKKMSKSLIRPGTRNTHTSFKRPSAWLWSPCSIWRVICSVEWYLRYLLGVAGTWCECVKKPNKKWKTKRLLCKGHSAKPVSKQIELGGSWRDANGSKSKITHAYLIPYKFLHTKSKLCLFIYI